jgi:hypothetical protein
LSLLGIFLLENLVEKTMNCNGDIVKCKVCTEVEGKNKILVAKWDSFVSMKVVRKL